MSCTARVFVTRITTPPVAIGCIGVGVQEHVGQPIGRCCTCGGDCCEAILMSQGNPKLARGTHALWAPYVGAAKETNGRVSVTLYQRCRVGLLACQGAQCQACKSCIFPPLPAWCNFRCPLACDVWDLQLIACLNIWSRVNDDNGQYISLRGTHCENIRQQQTKQADS